MRIALKNQKEVAHVWAQQSQNQGNAASMFFDGRSIFSYGRHFEIARFITPEIVFFTDRSYSISTQRHISYTHSAVSHKTCFTVHSFTDHRENVDNFLKDIDGDLLSAYRSRPQNKEWRIERVKASIESMLQYRDIFKKELTKDQLKALKVWEARKDNLLSDEEKAKLKKRVAEMNAATKIKNAEIAQRLSVRLEAERKEEAETLAKWIAGEDVRRYFHSSVVHLRIKDETIQTTKGAEVPLIEARKLWHGLQDRKDVTGMRVGHYTVSKLDTVNLTIGCHTIPLKEVLRMGLQLGWKNEVLL